MSLKRQATQMTYHYGSQETSNKEDLSLRVSRDKQQGGPITTGLKRQAAKVTRHYRSQETVSNEDLSLRVSRESQQR